MEVLATAIKEDKEIQVIQIWKEEIKLSLSEDDMTLIIENPKDITRKLLGLVNEFSKVVEYKIIHRNLFHSCLLTMEDQKRY